VWEGSVSQTVQATTNSLSLISASSLASSLQLKQLPTGETMAASAEAKPSKKRVAVVAPEPRKRRKRSSHVKGDAHAADDSSCRATK